jgi:hypothetical protein
MTTGGTTTDGTTTNGTTTGGTTTDEDDDTAVVAAEAARAKEALPTRNPGM